MELRVTEPIPGLARAEEIQAGRGRVLEELALGKSLAEVLGTLTESTERVIPGVLCSVLLYDSDAGVLRNGAAPSMPQHARDAIDGIAVAEGSGVCGTAAHRRRRVVVSDVQTDELTTDWRELVGELGIRAMWSEPILSANDELLGTFALYYGDERSPSPDEIEFMRTSAHLACIAIERTREVHTLRESEERLSTLLANLHEVVWLTDWKGKELLYVSPSYAAIWGRSCQSLYDDPKSWADAIHPKDRERVFVAFRDGAGQGRYEEEYRIVLPDGGVRWIYDRAFPIVDDDGSVYRVAGISEDVTERHRVEQDLRRSREELEARVLDRTQVLEATTQRLEREVEERERAQAQLRESEARFRELAENINEVFWLSAADFSRVYYVSPAYERVWGRKVGDLYANPQDWLLAIHAEDRERVLEQFGRHASEGSYDEEYRILRPDGELRWINDRGFVVPGTDGEAVRVAGLALDITARKEAESQVERHREKLRSLASELVLAEERERRALAVDLHDGLNQTITLAQIRLQTLRERAGEDLGEEVDEISSLVSSANESARSLTFQLSPPVLHDFGLEAGVQWLADEMTRLHGLPIEVLAPEEPISMDERVCVLMYRAARELILNVVKHAQAARASVQIEQVGESVRVVVEDDGRSFEPLRDDEGGLGLFSIRERLGDLGGSMQIEARLGIGTRVVLVSPLTVAARTE